MIKWQSLFVADVFNQG